MKKTVTIIICICITVCAFASCAKSESAENESIVYSYDSAYSFDDSTVRTYKDICQAVVNGEEEVRINAGMLDGALQLFYTSFPLSALVNNIYPQDSTYKIDYKYDDHTERVSEFIKKVNEISKDCAAESDTEYAVNLYNYIASSVKASDNSGINCYETVMTGEGTSFSYSNMFEYILQQRGIKAYHVICNTTAISAAELDGEMYYFDLYKEYEDNGGKLLKYFGMTSDDVKSYGVGSMIYTSRAEAAKAESLRFEALRNCKEWKIKSKELLVTDGSGEIVQVAL